MKDFFENWVNDDKHIEALKKNFTEDELTYLYNNLEAAIKENIDDKIEFSIPVNLEEKFKFLYLLLNPDKAEPLPEDANEEQIFIIMRNFSDFVVTFLLLMFEKELTKNGLIVRVKHLPEYRPDNFILLTDKISRDIFSGIEIKSNKEYSYDTRRNAGRREIKKATVKLVFDISLIEDELKKIYPQIAFTYFDLLVYSTFISFWIYFENENIPKEARVISMQSFYETAGLSLKTRGNEEYRNKVLRSIDLFTKLPVKIDNTVEAATMKGYVKYNYKRPRLLLTVDIIEKGYINGGLTENAMLLVEPPELLRFLQFRTAGAAQITSIPVKALAVPMSNTNITLAVKFYLMREISKAQHKKEKYINFDPEDLIKELQIDRKTCRKSRIEDYMNKSLIHFSSEDGGNWIKKYSKNGHLFEVAL